MIKTVVEREVITPNEYIQDFFAPLDNICKTVMKAQEGRAREAEARGETGKEPRRLEEGEHVLLRHPLPKLREDLQIKVSAKLQPKVRLEAYAVLKRGGEAYVLGGVATEHEITMFTQPAYADLFVPLSMSNQELSASIDEQTKIILEGIHAGRAVAQALDGRVKVELADRTREEQFNKTYKKLGASLDERRGVWVDLAQFDHHYFEDQAGGIHYIETYAQMHFASTSTSKS